MIELTQAILLVGGLMAFLYKPSIITGLFGMITIIYCINQVIQSPFISIGLVLIFILYLYHIIKLGLDYD